MSRPLTVLLLALALLCAAVVAVQAQNPSDAAPTTAEQHVEAGRRYAQARQYDRAVEAFKAALKLKPELAAAYHGLGAAYMSMGRHPDALEPLRTGVRLEPDDLIARLNLGLTLLALRRSDEALSEFNEAKRINPKDARVHNEIGNALHNGFGRIEEALAAYQEARRLNPNISAVHHNIGLMLMRLGRFSEAIEPFNEALRLSPDYQNARYHLSHAYSRTGRYEEAVESWGKFLELRPRGPEALEQRAWNLMYLGGRGEEAAASARECLEVVGWRAKVAPFMALLAHFGYRQAGREAEARGMLEEAAKHFPAEVWPCQIINYLRGEVTAKELLEQADDPGKKTEARTYIGMDWLLKGKGSEARAHFGWVKEYGNKQYLEFPLALAELKRLGEN